jgi:RNA polymerase sigma-70 factor (ECF subfamily)
MTREDAGARGCNGSSGSSDLLVIDLRETGVSDAELLSASSADPEAFGVFYDRHAAAVLAFLVRRTDSAQLAADLVAETFAAAFISRRRYRDTGAPALAWLLGIARHKLASAVRSERVERRARKRLALERIEVDDRSLERIEELAELEELRRDVDQALSMLTPIIAEAVQLRVLLELPYAEVARRLGCSEGTARVRVARGLTVIADALEVRAC